MTNIEKIRVEIEQNAYPIVHGVNNHEKGMTLYGIFQVLDKYAEQEPCEWCNKIPEEPTMTREEAIYHLKTYDDPIKVHEAYAMAIKALEQESKTGYISIDDVMSVFDDFMCGEVDEDETNTFLEMLKDKAESEDKE